jgi:hypothetical protein
MKRMQLPWITAHLALVGILTAPEIAPLGSTQPADANSLQSQAHRARLQAAYGQFPLSFTANQGQTDAQVKFLSRGSGYSMFLTPTTSVMMLSQPLLANATSKAAKPTAASPPGKHVVLRTKLVGANLKTDMQGENSLPGKVNYLRGKDVSQWRVNIPTYRQVRAKGVYPGIDLVYYGNQRQLQYDFIVAPGANPQAIQMQVQGADQVSINRQGELVLKTAVGEVKQHRPLIYQTINGKRQIIAGNFRLIPSHSKTGGRTVTFDIADYDATKPLVIDPVLSYSTYLGGSGVAGAGNDGGNDIVADSSGNAYVTGQTNTYDFPTTPGTVDTVNDGPDVANSREAFVAKINADGSGLIYSTYLGGSGEDWGNGIALGSAGSIYVTGYTRSENFPTTLGALSTTLQGTQDAFVTKLNADGTGLVYSTYLGGGGSEAGSGIVIDPPGNAYITGRTDSANFPTTAGVYDPAANGGNDAFITKLNASGTSLVYSTYLGGSSSDAGEGITLGTFLQISTDYKFSYVYRAYVVGSTSSNNFPVSATAYDSSANGGTDTFITQINTSGTSLIYSSYLGGGGDDFGFGIALTGIGTYNAYITGRTNSNNFPTTPGAYDTSFNGGGNDAFVLRLNSGGSGLLYSTYLGGSGEDTGNGIIANSAGNAYVAGSTSSNNFPITLDAYDMSFNGGFGDAFVTQLNSSGSGLLNSTYLGGSGGNNEGGNAIALDSSGNFYVTGIAAFPGATGFPTTVGAYDPSFNGGEFDAFVLKFNP